jgi:gluconokinase
MSDPADPAAYRPCVLICMGVSGAGKTTVARLIDETLGWPFQEGDELHSAANVEKMKHKIPLTDADRWPWLDRCRDWIDGRLADDGRGVITCSALKRVYRDRLIADRRAQVRILYLRASRETLLARLEQRRGHYMPVDLLDSQLATLEEPAPDENPIIVSVDQPIEEMAKEVLALLR